MLVVQYLIEKDCHTPLRSARNDGVELHSVPVATFRFAALRQNSDTVAMTVTKTTHSEKKSPDLYYEPTLFFSHVSMI